MLITVTTMGAAWPGLPPRAFVAREDVPVVAPSNSVKLARCVGDALGHPIIDRADWEQYEQEALVELMQEAPNA